MFLSSAFVLGVNPVLEMGGRIAAIVICLFILVLVVVTLVLNIVVVWGMSWLSEKSEMVKVVRPVVESVNKNMTQAKQGMPVDENENGVVRAIAKVPASVQKIDDKTVRVADKAAKGLIEVRARTVQAKTVLKAFFLPGLMRREMAEQEASQVEKDGKEFRSPGYRMLMEEEAPEIPVEAAREGGERQRMEVQQLRNVTSR